jgi:hypothetical protein
VLNLTAADRRFCGRWLLATMLAIALCNPLGPIGLFIGPVVLATTQSDVLRREGHRFWPWGIATLVSGYLAIALFTGLFLGVPKLPIPVMVLICGAIVGAAQGWVLRRESRYWRWWPLLNALILTVSLSWFMPGVLNAAIYGTQRVSLTWLALATLTGLIGGLLKGLALAWLFKHPARPGRH